MNVAPIDHTHAIHNPWGLTPHQCCALRLVCKYGSAKQAWANTDIPCKTLESHIQEARKSAGFRGHDLRFYLAWHQWYTDFLAQKTKRPSHYKP